jgi:hypothetical protein
MSVGFWHHQLYSDLGADTVMESIAINEAVVSGAGHPKWKVTFPMVQFPGAGYSD